MKLNITGKGIEITKALREHTEDKASKLPRYYSSITSVDVILDNDNGGNPSVEVIARAEHNKVFVVKEKSDGGDRDMYACLDIAIHKIERQISKAKDKERNPIHNGSKA